MEVRPRNNVFTSAQAFVTARAVTTRWYQQPPLGGMPLGERGLMLACCHAAGCDVCPAYPGVCKRGLAGQHRVTHCTAQSSSGTLFGGTLYATARDTHIVPTPSLNYHDHTQHASFSCWLLDALVKSPLA